jgi:cellulose biosynthesis protein BcsQ
MPPSSMEARLAEANPGLVCTFYSYKGGVGRSMALANVAALLARWGKKVLVVDWDLEAPGLDKYFVRPGVRLVRDTLGLVDMVSGFQPDRPLEWRAGLLHASIPSGQEVAILHAGRNQPDTYLDRLRSIEWRVLFQRGLGSALEEMRADWRDSYDYILIDSRTGITDIGGICSILLPDYLLVMFTTNEQSLEGIRDTMVRVQGMHADLPLDRQKLVIIPVPARDESHTEYVSAAEWRSKFARELAPLYYDWIPKRQEPDRDRVLEVMDYLKIPNVPFWSFGERLPVLEEAPDNPKNLAYSYSLIAKLINSRLDWSEVREGAQARAEEARQTAVSEERVATARAIREQAQETEVRLAEERLQKLRAVVFNRYQVLLSRRRSYRVRAETNYLLGWVAMVALVAGVASVVLYSAVMTGDFVPRELFPHANHGIIGGFVLAALYAGVFGIVFLRSRFLRTRRDFELLEQEKVMLETGAGVYVDRTELDALRVFAARIETVQTDASAKAIPPDATARPTPMSGAHDIAAGSGTLTTDIVSTYSTTGSVNTVGGPVPDVGTQTPSSSVDVLLCYQPAPLTTDWVREFRSLLQAWLGESLGRQIVIRDLVEETAPDARALLSDGTGARMAIIIASRRLLNAAWAQETIRDIVTAFGNGRFISVTLDRSAIGTSKELNNYQYVDFSDLAYIGEGFVKSERYLDFQDRVRSVAVTAAKIIESTETSKLVPADTLGAAE